MNAATAATTATRQSFRARMLGLTVLGNLGGALLTFLYFRDVDPTAVSGRGATTGAEIAYFVIAFGLLFAVGRHLSMRWLAPLTRAGAVPAARPGRRHCAPTRAAAAGLRGAGERRRLGGRGVHLGRLLAAAGG